jgi:hypothetical protein
MTTSGTPEATDVARTHAQDAAQQATARAGEVGDHAATAAGDVKDTAVGQAQQVKDETVRQAKDVAAQAQSQLKEQARAQSQRASANLHDLGDELRQMAQAGTGGPASQLADQAADRAHQLGGYLENREPGDIVDDMRHWARQRPGAFLAGAAVLGLAVGRIGRGVKDTSGSTSSGSPSSARSTTGRSARSSASGIGTSRSAMDPYPTEPPLTAPPGEQGFFDGYRTTVPEDYVDAERTVGSTADYQTELVQPEFGDLESGR